ncbi:class I adenylate-forming enzyme family protein [Rhodophyticola sp.]|jgi:acyl-coenzyme A synthetase/AMP-(fatty) acid ligase|uniref:class I adenylate-forming enzyme family protein n=1 Tax=Rhodophyticola sp. TaxID=2680032 RepID=UPI003D2DAD8B
MQEPCHAPFNLAAHVLSPAAQTPDKIALAVLSPTGADRWSYARLETAVRGMATGLLGMGLTPGDRVLLRLGNTPDFPIAYLACIAVGLVPVPTSAQLTTPEITRLADVIRPALILAAPGIALPEPVPCPVARDLGALAAHPAAGYLMGDPDRLAYLVFTSGTSGRPRAVAHAHRAIWARRMMWEGWYGLTAQDRLLHAGAFNWTFTLGTGLLDPWAAGATALVPAEGLELSALPLLLKRHDVTIFAAAPGVYRKMLMQSEILALPRLRHGLSAGEKLPEALRKAWQRATGTPVHEALGMSECSTFISGSPARPAPEGTLGYPQAGRRVAVLDQDGHPVSKGGTGTLAIHRDDPGLMLGYLEDGKPHLPLTGDWFLTGDQVSEAEDGALIYHGRRDDMLNAGGFRVSPHEIEAAFADLPGLTDCAAVAIEASEGVFIVAMGYTGPIEEDSLRHAAEAGLARYKQPRLYARLAALPRTANGKLDRAALRACLKEVT